MKLRNLPDRAAVVKRRGRRTVRVETLDVKDVLNIPRAVERLRALVSKRSGYLSPREAVEIEIEARQRGLFPRREEAEGDEMFWQEEPAL